jgi:hypothetical protein
MASHRGVLPTAVASIAYFDGQPSRPATRRAGPPLADIEQAKGVVRAASGEQLDAQATFERLRGGPVLDASAGG